MPGSIFGNSVKRRFLSNSDIKFHIDKSIKNNNIERLRYYFGLLDNKNRKYQGKTFLNIACAYGKLESFNFLLSNGVQIDDETFVYAIVGNNIEIVNELIKHGVNINTKDSKGYTPLMRTIIENKPELFNKLIEHNANVNIVLTKEIIPDIIVNNDNPINYAVGTSPLMIAVTQNFPEVNFIKTLLDKGANIDWIDAHGKTALMYAAQFGVDEIVKLLIDRNADIEILDQNNRNAFLYSVNSSVAKTFLDKGTDINRRDIDGLTLLMIAAQNSYVNLVKFLLDSDADTTILDNSGNAAEYYATNREIKGLFAGTRRVERMWKGFSKVDIGLLNSIFESESYNYSCCPVCLKYSERQSGCMYMRGHDCSVNPGYYNVELYEKYKSNDGSIQWCTVCCRICKDHRHLAISRAEGPTPGYEPNPSIGYYGNDCLPYGGGNPEKAMRFKALREKAWELKDTAGKITESEAMDQLVVAMWNAPLNPERFNASKNLKEKKWLEHPVENYPAAGPNIANIIVYPDIPVPPERQMPTLIDGTNAATFDDGKVLVFNHPVAETGESYHVKVNPDSLCNKDSFIEKLQIYMDPASSGDSHFGYCWDQLCKAKLYPIEVKTALELYGPLTPEETEFCNKYKLKFNEIFRKRRGGGNSKEESSIFRPLTDGMCMLPPKGKMSENKPKSSGGRNITQRKRKQRRATRYRRK